MNTTIDHLLTNVYELEGLLLVMQRHSDDMPHSVIDRFIEKAEQLAASASILNSLPGREDALPASPEAPLARIVPTQSVPEQRHGQPAVTPPPHLEPPVFAPSEPVASSPAPAVRAQRHGSTSGASSETVITPVTDPIIVPECDTQPGSSCDTKSTVETTEVFAPQEECQVPDITSSFSINDRFMFTRELFDNNKQKYDDAIAAMQRLADIDKIKEFITETLSLDLNDEQVKEFVRLVDLSLKR